MEKILKRSAQEAMSLEKQLFQEYEKGHRTELIFQAYSFEQACITYGYTLPINQYLNEELLQKENIPIVRRPTGGGLVFHQTSDIIFSLVALVDHALLPQGLVPSFLWLARHLIEVLKGFRIHLNLAQEDSHGFDPICFSHSRQYEITYQHKKVVGIAQRRGRRALLMQGSMACHPIQSDWQKYLKNEKNWQELTEGYGYIDQPISLEIFDQKMKQALK